MKKKTIKVRATYEFEVDVSDFDTKHVDVEGLAKELTRREVDTLDPYEFEYEIVERDVYYE